MRKAWFAGFVLVWLGQVGVGQGGPEGFRLEWGCTAPEINQTCLEPLGLVRFGLSRTGSWAARVPWEANFALGARLGVTSRFETVTLRAVPALWLEAGAQAGLLEAYAEAPLGEFSVSLGKRADLGGPWDDTLLGRDGRWGVFAGYAPSSLPRLGARVAYLPNPGLAGGQGFAGVSAGPLRLGAFGEVVQRDNGLGELESAFVLSPRVGLESGVANLYWQRDRGFWSELDAPLPLGTFAVFLLQCPPDREDVPCWGRGLPEAASPEAQALTGVLNRTRLEGLLWWNPDWSRLDPQANPALTDEERFRDFFGLPNKFLVGLAVNWDGRLRLGFDLSRSPVEAARAFVEYRVRY